MLAPNIELKPGLELFTPSGRRLEIEDIFVPRNDHIKSRHIPAQFRAVGRKIVVFRNGSISHLKEVLERYSEEAMPGH